MVDKKEASPGSGEKRYLICGSRDFADAVKFVWFLSGLPKPDVVISGMASGADTLAVMWAEQQGVPVLKFPADWKRWGKAAGMKRNQQMYDEGKPTHILGFPTNPNAIGPGTRNMLDIGKSNKVPTYYAEEKKWVAV